MFQNKLSLWVHIVWGVKNRDYLITGEIKSVLMNKIEAIAEEKGYEIVEKYSMPDHVHILIKLNPKHSISEMMKNIKGISAYWINKQGLGDTNFEWQEGYGAFSVSAFAVSRVISYIQNQEKHHSEKNFEGELLYLSNMGQGF